MNEEEGKKLLLLARGHASAKQGLTNRMTSSSRRNDTRGILVILHRHRCAKRDVSIAVGIRVVNGPSRTSPRPCTSGRSCPVLICQD